MRFCHECGAVVAPEDGFCSYCGISLQPVAIASETNGEKSQDEKSVEHSSSQLVEKNFDEASVAENQSDLAMAEATPFKSSNYEAAAALAIAQEINEFNLSGVEQKSPEEALENLPEDDEPATVLNQSFQFSQTDVSENKPETLEPATLNEAVHAEEFDKVSNQSPEKKMAEDFQATLIEHSTDFSKSNSSVEAISNQLSEDSKPKVQVDEIVEREPLTIAEQSALAADRDANQIGELPPRQTGFNKPQETPGAKSPKLKSLDDNTILNRRYHIIRRIGGGGMGAVYLAKDLNLGGVQRAVKEMVQAYVDESQQEKAVQDFRRESLLLSQLEHPAVPTIYDYFYEEGAGRFYLVMKYISGGDLAARLRSEPKNRIDERSVTEWAIQIADVLDYLHNHEPPIVYRDLKPSNIMLDGISGKAMLVDFGIARWVNKEEKGVTAVGTMGYAPPELFAGNAEPRSDIYSLGATMFHLLTGADPQNNPLLIFDFTKNPRPRQINPSLSVEIEDILLRAVEYNASLRFESAAKLREALQQHLEKVRAGRLTYERDKPIKSASLPSRAKHSAVSSSPPASPNMVFCGFCGEKIIATDLYCAYCGAPQAAARDSQPLANSRQLEQTMLSFNPPLVAGGAATTATARLVVIETGKLEEPMFSLEKENNLIGREDRRSNIFPEIDLTRYDTEPVKISRRHARIWREGTNYWIEDLKSANGTILIGENNKTVRLQPNQPHVLQNGDKLKLGETTLRFYVN